MSNKTINLLADVVLPCVTVVLTAILFFMFRPDESTGLFWLNLCYTIMLEGVFFGYIISLNHKTESIPVPIKAVFGVFALYYIVVGLGCMLFYSLLLVHFLSIKFYVSVLIIITLLWIIGAMLTAQVGSNYQAAQEKTDEKRKVLTFYNEKMKMFASRYAALCNEKQLVYDTESNQRTVLDKLSAKVNGLSPGLFKNETAGMQLNAIVNKCELLIDEAETATAEQLPEVDRKMKRFVEKALLEIDMLQNLAKG